MDMVLSYFRLPKNKPELEGVGNRSRGRGKMDKEWQEWRGEEGGGWQGDGLLSFLGSCGAGNDRGKHFSFYYC